MLIGTGQLVEQGRLAAVLVSDQSKCKQRIIRKRITGPLGMKTAFFSETGVLGFPGTAFHALRCGKRVERLDLNPCGIIQPQRQFISVNAKLHRVSHGS